MPPRILQRKIPPWSLIVSSAQRSIRPPFSRTPISWSSRWVSGHPSACTTILLFPNSTWCNIPNIDDILGGRLHRSHASCRLGRRFDTSVLAAYRVRKRACIPVWIEVYYFGISLSWWVGASSKAWIPTDGRSFNALTESVGHDDEPQKLCQWPTFVL